MIAEGGEKQIIESGAHPAVAVGTLEHVDGKHRAHQLGKGVAAA